MSFHDAAVRTAQLGYDLKIPHLAFFSWPSKGRLSAYLKDQGSVQVTMKALGDYLELVVEQAQAAGKPLHVLAHSMGNYVLLDAILRLLALVGQGRPKLTIKSTIFAAPDLPAARLQQIVELMQTISPRKTLYVSAKDRALLLSGHLKGQPNAGEEITIAPGLQTIDVVGRRLSLLGHSYYAELKEVIADMHQLIHFGAEPDQRAILQRKETVQHETYWQLP